MKTTTPFRNIHVTPPPPVETAQPIAMPRLREVTNDPATEFQNRPGLTKPLADEIVALILFRKEWRDVGRDGITVNNVKFWSENSITIAAADTEEKRRKKVLITYNRHEPNIIHVLTDDGAYVESIPAKTLVPWFDAEATEKQLGAVRRDHARTTERLVDLHGADSLAALATAQSNVTRMHHAVDTFEKPASTEACPTLDRLETPDRESTPTMGAGRASSAELIQQAETQASRAQTQRQAAVKRRKSVNVAQELLKTDRVEAPAVNLHDW